ncbi:MAG: Asp-tRNA(Asn)/Glu-tRNA(Gln) amidotransferase subunit GatC [Gammaproteobacteria bacterium]|nr:Asp-tRNA(Asn)/Glu-tRNA(Gln) amidotransferase subunit GatC [Gammaproteobacteria bacterium]
MVLDQETIARIATLARLHIEDHQTERLATELSRILELAEQMNQIATDDVQPMAHPLDQTLRRRPDRVTETDQRETFQALAPAVEGGLYLVPKVID